MQLLTAWHDAIFRQTVCLLQDFCPCENQCNNQMFSRRQYAKVAVVRCGPNQKGGLGMDKSQHNNSSCWVPFLALSSSGGAHASFSDESIAVTCSCPYLTCSCVACV
jgi:hypothetical protein